MKIHHYMIYIIIIILYPNLFYGFEYDKDTTNKRILIYHGGIDYKSIDNATNDNKLLNNATLNEYATTSGTNGTISVFYIGNTMPTTFSGGTINFYYDGTALGGSTSLGGLFVARPQTIGDAGPITFDSNISVNIAPNSNMGRAFFLGLGSATRSGDFIFKKNLIVNVDNALPRLTCDTTCDPRTGWRVRSIFELENQGNAYVNYDPTTGQTLNPDNIIQLKGDINFSDTRDSKNSNVFINLSNSDSFLIGITRTARNDPASNSFANLTLQNGGKWYLTGSSIVNNLNISNPSKPKSLDTYTEKSFSIVDLSHYDSSNINGVYCPTGECYRLISPTPFASRTLNVNTINGNNGVFRLMADVDRGLIDTIRA
ncbi:hypothetical protein, partial [Helicobacter sp. 13S00477-4]|uniref:hypothetical protein n=1 Tax=Helicobacter sp. 13S00477-4 TaxID=1905759 RepID=UPI0015DA5B93